MTDFFFVLNNNDSKYEEKIKELGIILGDRKEVIERLKNDENFCRKNSKTSGININFLLFIIEGYPENGMEGKSILYIKNNGKIVGCCALSFYDNEKKINIAGICVPESNNRGNIRVGQLLIDKVKEIGNNISFSKITLSVTNETLKTYYEEKHKFIMSEDGVMIFKLINFIGGKYTKRNKKQKTKNKKTSKKQKQTLRKNKK
uniref:N-acetyltransferase domain-containing protein n=1 Tax=viral metagenome TaxID=1070528 RepID=A0A6C0HT57_9ZZZZ